MTYFPEAHAVTRKLCNIPAKRPMTDVKCLIEIKAFLRKAVPGGIELTEREDEILREFLRSVT